MKLFVAVVVVCFCFGRAGGQSALELCCLVLRGMEASQLPGGEGGRVSFGVWCETVRRRRRRRLFLFWGRGGRGRVSFRAVKGEGGPVSFGVGCETVRRRRRRRRLFLFWAGGGRVSFRGVGCETVRRRRRLFLFWAGGGRVSFRGCEGGRGASQLWSWV